MSTPSALLELSPLVQRIITYLALGLAVAWLIRHFRKASQQTGCTKCPHAAASPPQDSKKRLPVLRS